MGLANVLAALKVRAGQVAMKLWQDDTGAIISTEYVLIGGVLVSGIIPGLVTARNSINQAYTNMGNTILSAVPAPTYSGFAVGGANGPIAAVNGVAVAPVSTSNAAYQVSYLPPSPQVSYMAPSP
jgi:Flp pilus assembly pilin Flp